MKTDIYQTVTNNIVEALEQVSLDDYKAPFARLTGQKMPINPVTANQYHGINTLVLWLEQQVKGYSCNEWGTFKQWKDKGAQVKKGEKSSLIIFYKRVEKKDTDGNDPEYYNMLKSYRVFNADQVEGYESKLELEEGQLSTVERIEQIEQFVTATSADIHTEKNKACFCPSTDHIEMPCKDRFFDTDQSATENYYAVLLHELTHWTGGKKRLDREQVGYGSNKESYAFEELIAELGSAFLCSQFGIMQQGRDDHAIYIKSWLQALKNDKKLIFKASAQAQKAVDFLNNLQGG
ncbi:zincin-like metallopeptidase domain-containing protein [Porticoccus sp. W117]|uniref:ArdC family protein n=1 Tax=Porticoccus sp. W117 TaxID=3054777 RepID=UPI0025967FBD|nr:zincin-like metallopeptidase domain-containing protein [Porticoccus sp. W117]MDM3871797.1 zincin-like metallopeptidase domain-containing protein [Porticoccus sp. W117]